jgi:hypothetical protein
MVPLDRPDKSPRSKGEDAECDEDGDREYGYAHRLTLKSLGATCFTDSLYLEAWK